MNVLESLKVSNATVLNIKDKDILFIKINDHASEREITELNESLSKSLLNKGYKDITILISQNVEDIKIIRR